MLAALEHAIFSAANPILATFLWSMLPVTELRATIPLAITAYGLSSWTAYALSVFGTSTITFLLLLLLDPAVRLLRHIGFIDRFMHWLFARTRTRFTKESERYGFFLALVIFVAIPLPGTGGWTGALIAYLFGIPLWRAFAAITLGLVLSGFIVLAITNGTLAIF
ncbi:MAG: small multi-drug export protein [Patescibacteria group bacterium]|jgi:uncharacterized membrane protein